jgi:hypothetical protein
MTFRRSTKQAVWAVGAIAGFAFPPVHESHASSPSEADMSGAESGARVTFSGFQRGKYGDGVVFVHVTERTGLAVQHTGTRVNVRLRGASVHGRNNLHPLDLSQFDLLLLSSRLTVVDGDVELQLELRREAHLDAQWVERPDGVLSLHVVIPRL